MKIGTRVELTKEASTDMVAQPGARAIVIGELCNGLIEIVWESTDKRVNGQSDGHYWMTNFIITEKGTK